MTTVCAASGTLLYCYSATLAPLRSALAWAHEITGWVATLLLGAYLSSHLRRTWRLRAGRPVSWWTGVAGALAWLISFAAGVWMELEPIARYATVWWWHGVASFAVVVILCFHAAYGFRSWTMKGATHE